MKRKLIGFAALLVISTLSFAGTKTTYMMVPSNIQVIYSSETGAKQYVHLMAMDSEDNVIESDDIVVGKNAFYKDDNPEEVHSDLYKISIDSSADDVKLVAGYKIEGKDKYIILSADNADGEALQSKYESIANDYLTNPPTPIEVLGIVSISDYSNYNDFPGHVVVDQTLLTVVKAGEKTSEDESGHESEPTESDLSEPSNIVEKFYQPPTDGDQITIGAGTKVNPTNSYKNYEFTVLDKNGDPAILMKNESDTYADPINNTFVDDSGVIDLKNLDNHLEDNTDNLTLTENGNIVLFSDDADSATYMGPYTIRVRFQGDPIGFNGVLYDGQRTFEFEVKEPTIIYGGSGNEFWLEIDEDGVLFPPGERPDDAPPKPAGPAVYLVESNGMVMDGETVMKSQTDESKKQRISDVELKIKESGMTGYELKRLDEKGRVE